MSIIDKISSMEALYQTFRISFVRIAGAIVAQIELSQFPLAVIWRKYKNLQ